MKLSEGYLLQRHDFWKDEIAKTGIWKSELFQPVSIRIRPKCKRYNGMFSRKWILKDGKKIVEDRISIYRNSEDFDPIFLDSLLVHEMIHQYIYQNGLKDTSTHGRLFKSFKDRINESFRGRLNINISDHNPMVPLKGPGTTMHRLVLSWNDKDCYCCVINPSRLREFDRMLKRFKKTGTVKDYFWALSNDVHFDRYVRCTKTLHGIKKPMSEMISFCRQYNVMKAPL